MRIRRVIGAAVAITAVVLTTASSCDDSAQPEAQAEESERQQDGYTTLTENQPAGQMSYSPTRETINFWIDTWDEPGKLSYVYLQAANGELLGYYVFEGLPVSYCASLTPTYGFEKRDLGNYSGDIRVPAPAMDGAFYFGCPGNAFYGRDAGTGSYIEYTAGLGINVLLYDQPLARQDVQPLGHTTIEDVEDEG